MYTVHRPGDPHPEQPCARRGDLKLPKELVELPKPQVAPIDRSQIEWTARVAVLCACSEGGGVDLCERAEHADREGCGARHRELVEVEYLAVSHMVIEGGGGREGLCECEGGLTRYM